MSYKFTNVATIKSPREVYVRVGLPISLTCEIIPTSDSGSLAEKSRVRWMHKGQEITSESDRGGISVDTDYRERKITSRLRVSMVTADDEGFYTCTQEATRQDSVKLSVVQAEHSEAMQRDAAYSKASRSGATLSLVIVYLLISKTIKTVVNIM
ncbi:PREDICTED: uncharacterized protein LOC108566700 [Nicrophorus vespilloides]|uniref:Uncharacterized protein LOC108566700 n=1 Tax=Nicrophorus vespilloides TaxID=110193 RepID=A0ABM1N5V6_NICVS|nr:PREDICTED: uncharacterized protein LOC108566700 [Nicrophorus vespilloides]